METVLKQVLGVDVAQNKLVVTFGRLTNDLAIDLVAHFQYSKILKMVFELY